MSYPRRGQVWLVNLDPTIGSEMKKSRPCVVIQNNIGNQHAPTTIIAPITSTLYESPVTIVLEKDTQKGLHHKSCINLAQIRCVDKSRLAIHLGTLNPADMELVNNALKRSLAL